MAASAPCPAAMTSGQSGATPRITTGWPPGRISARNCSGVGAARSAMGVSASVRNELIGVPFAPAGIDPFRAQGVDVRGQPLREFLFVARALRPPRNLREREHAREDHELKIALGRDEFGPDSRLDADHMRLLSRGEAVRDRLPGEHLADRLRAALVAFPWRAGLARTLGIIEIKL